MKGPMPSDEERQRALNLEHIPDADGIIRGRCLPQGWFAEAVATTSLTLFVAWPWIFATLVVASLFSRAALALLVILLTSLTLPAKLLWPEFTQCFILSTWQSYFSFGWTLEAELPKTQNVIFAEYPHGAFPMGAFLACKAVVNMIPGHKVFALAASAVFYVPLYKHVMRWIGCLPASRQNLTKLLKEGSVAVVMGGIAEMFMLRDDREEVLLRNRSGLMKTSIELQTPIVLVYYMGNSRILKFGPVWLKDISRRLRTSLGFVYGRWGTPLPIKHHIEMVCSKPIQPDTLSLQPGEDGYDEAMAAACARLTDRLADELQALYQRHRHVVGWGEERPLVIH